MDLRVFLLGLFLSLVSSFVLYTVISRARRGYAWNGLHQYKRSVTPVGFWFSVIFYCVLATVLLLLGIVALVVSFAS